MSKRGTGIYLVSSKKEIVDGDMLDIIATNQYNGVVYFKDNEALFQTCFFDKPLHDHLSALDLQGFAVNLEPLF